MSSYEVNSIKFSYHENTTIKIESDLTIFFLDGWMRVCACDLLDLAQFVDEI